MIRGLFHRWYYFHQFSVTMYIIIEKLAPCYALTSILTLSSNLIQLPAKAQSLTSRCAWNVQTALKQTRVKKELVM